MAIKESGLNKALKAAKRVLPVYRQTIDAWAEGMLTNDTNERVSCKKGCHSCCYNLVKATMAEGTAIAAHLLEKRTFEQHRPQLEKTAALTDSFADNDDATFRYLASKTPCAFLKDGECSIYELRPAACRTYFVASDPRNCSPDLPGAEVGYVDARAPTGFFISEIVKATHPTIPMLIGPFPSVVLAGKELLERSPGAFKRWSQKSPLFTANADPVTSDEIEALKTISPV
jgi:Fe-S-cluster containining protein